MNNFIEVADADGICFLINIRTIRTISQHPDNEDWCLIYIDKVNCEPLVASKSYITLRNLLTPSR